MVHFASGLPSQSKCCLNYWNKKMIENGRWKTDTIELYGTVNNYTKIYTKLSFMDDHGVSLLKH